MEIRIYSVGAPVKRFSGEKLKMGTAFYTAIIASLKMRSEEPTANKSRRGMLLILCEGWLGARAQRSLSGHGEGVDF